MSVDINKAIDDVQGIANTVKEISDNSNATMQSITNNSVNNVSESDTSQNVSLSIADTIKVLETSKKIVYILLAFFILSFIAMIVIRIVFKLDLFSNLNYQLPLATTSVAAYYTKAGAEHVSQNKYGSALNTTATLTDTTASSSPANPQ